MRAIYYPDHNCQVGESLSIQDDNFHHLKNVIRVRQEEQVLVLNGKGEKAHAKVSKINRRDIELRVETLDTIADTRFLDVAFCLTKKASFDLAIKIAVELGIRKFTPLISEYSQTYTFSRTRINSLVTSAILQSNALYSLDVQEPISFTQFLENSIHDYNSVHFFDLESNNLDENIKTEKSRELILIGPEGGFSTFERDLIHNQENVNTHFLPVNILRASTALPAAVGFILGKQL